MSQPVLGAKNALICGECGTSNPPDARECWLCHGTRWKAKDQGGDHVPYPRGFFSTVSGWMILIAGIGLALGLYKLSPGILIAAVVLVLPPVLIVESRAARRRRAGCPMSMAERVGQVLLLTFMLPTVLVGALFIAVYVICSLGGTPPRFG